MFQNNLKKAREAKGISQLELSRRTRIAPANVSLIEHGKQYPYAGWRKRLAATLEVSEEELFPQEVNDCANNDKTRV